MSAGLFFRPMPPSLQPLTFLFLLCFFTLSQSDELDILLKFKSNLEKSNTHVFDSWTPENSWCNFTGIVCDSNQVVKEINLSGRSLSGTLPFGSICSLESLERISLGSNFLHGTIGEDLSNCSRLQHLDLGQNSFSGEVPDLSSLTQLKFLNLNLSGFSGEFPWKSLENLTGLTFLSLGDNQLERNSFPLEVLKLDKLYWLYLSNCSLEGEIPNGIGNLTLLENLELSDNHLIGEIPEGITKLTRLWQLELYDNQFSGKLPLGFGNLTNLVYFDASANNLEGDLSELKSLTKLASLQLFENQFSGKIPEEFGDFKFLIGLSLYANKLTGSLPQKLGSWSDFNYIDVSDNFLTGPLPPDMCKNGRTIDLLMLHNSFTGQIPESYANCSSLVRLRINNNSLSGIVPSGVWGLPQLTIIDLTLNQFEGLVTDDIARAKSLAQLFLANNRFSGELPESLSEASSLVSIELSSNQFSGKIPEKIGDLKKLSSIHLQDNMISGTIPDSLGSCTSLSYINLARNSISGRIPASIGSLPSLTSLILSGNKLSGQIPATLSSLRLSLLDLSNNRLIGQIPASLITEAYNGSFDGNPGLCSRSIGNFRPCSAEAGVPGEARTAITIYCLIAGITVSVVSLASFIYLKIRQRDQSHQNHPMKRGKSWNMKHFHLLSFSEDEVLNSIKQENLIGKGGSGNVYRVVLGSGKELAVKHIWRPDSSDRRSCRSTSAVLAKEDRWSPEFEAEVATLSSVRHMNVVKLYCSITSEDSNLLVYEYLQNGSLWDWLHTGRKTEMGWEVRYEIAVGAARGLEYLHHGCDRAVIHRDVKSSNILLDEQMRPRIADFGLAKIVHTGGAKDSTHVIAGTLGYIAPEYGYTYKVNEKCDVYSFGVVLMELVTGKRPVEPEFGESTDIVQWVRNGIRSERSMIDLVDSSISDGLKDDAAKVLRIAVHCTAEVPVLRPSMRMVVQMLEEAEPFRLNSIVIGKEG